MDVAAGRLRQAALLATFCGAAALVGPAPGQETNQRETRAAVPQPPAPADIIVRGRGYSELRLRIRLAEEAVFARFNEINSTDDFDIHCRTEAVTGTRIHSRSCLSNSWREQDANMAQALIRRMRGEGGPPPDQFRGEQLVMQRRLSEEAQRLALEDEALGEAVLQLGQARLALAARTGGREDVTRWRQVSAGSEGLPYDAERMFEVKVGGAPWSHLLTQPTFTISSVTGNIRSLTLNCKEDERIETAEIEFASDVEWTLPAEWSSCILHVRARRDTTFALFEF
jgi:hypothetical protein